MRIEYSLRSAVRALIAGALVLFSGSPARAQSLLERSPNVSGDWTGASGTLYFHFVHRFTASDAPERKVSNVPTFLIAAGLPKAVLLGFNYSTNSTLAPRFPNEWELFARWMPVSQDRGAPLDLGAQVGYNNAADGGDAEISAARRFGKSRLLLAGRALSDPLEAGNVRIAAAAGATVRLNQFFALAGDVGSLLARDSTERLAWSAGIHFAIPLTPHTVSIHATNALVTTLQGASRGSRDVRYGFEFTIPLTLRRYFGTRARQDDEPADPPQATAPAADTTRAADTPAASVPAPPTTAAPTAPAPVTARPDTTKPEPATRTAAPPPAPAPARTSTPRPTQPATTTPPRTQQKVVRTGIRNVNYLQPRLTITVGTTVEWTNNDPMPHTVTAVDKSFDSGLINPGKTWRRTFTRAGTYDVFCVPHPFMKGVIVVREP